MSTDSDTKFMRLALRLAKKGEGRTSPNPMVGAVLVKNGEIIGKGYHKKAGFPHAEIEAFNDARRNGQKIEGSTLYVSLEPCCHNDKKTPPCTEAIIKNGIRKVIVGAFDANPKVSGKGVRKLRKANIDVTSGVLKDEAEDLNKMFFKYIKQQVPYAALKLASTLDGKIATKTGDSKWIGSDKQRRFAHELRDKYDAVLVGINTLLKDNPRLNVRLGKKDVSQPVPVIVDSNLRTPINSRFFRVHENVIIATSNRSKSSKIRSLRQKGAEILFLPKNKSGKISLKSLFRKLGKIGITSVLIEGGSAVASSALKEGVVDKLIIFYSPRIIGGDGVSMISELGIEKVKKSFQMKEIRIKKFGSELLVEADL